MRYMMMSEFMKGSSNDTSNGMNGMLPLLMMNSGGFGDMFDGMFDFDDDDTKEDEEDN